MSSESSEQENDCQPSVVSDYQPLSPPARHFDNMPLQIRWEVRRRHPIYQRFWKNALRYQRGQSPVDVAEKRTDFIAKILLGIIGHVCEAIDPATEFDQFSGHQEHRPFWLSGALRPVTNRDLIILMLASLPKQIRMVFAATLNIKDEMDGSENQQQMIDATTQWSAQTRSQVLSSWVMMADPVLDQYPDLPFFYANVNDSERVLKKEFDRLLKHYRKQRGITQTRQKNATKHLEDLRVWDEREGWQNGCYDMYSRKSFKQIAQRLRKPIPTLHSRYLSAFKLITGYSYSRERWVQFVLPILLTQVLNQQKYGDEHLVNKIKSQRRQGRRSVVRPISETTLSPDHGAEILDCLNSSELSSDHDTLIDLTIMIREVLTKNPKSTPLEIAKILGANTTQDSLEAIEVLLDQIHGSLEIN